MKFEASMAGEDFELAGTCSELAGIHFMIGKKNLIKIPEFKRFGIGSGVHLPDSRISL
jgi:hypothetical protein